MYTTENGTTASYDVVGQYNQDQINGFDEALIENFIQLGHIKNNFKILDAMGGNGNLSQRILKYCQQKGIENVEVTLLEYSQVQCDIAKSQIKHSHFHVHWGDIITLKNFGYAPALKSASFDVIFIKSGNHEIKKEHQKILYQNIFHLLKDGGTFLNLGFAFDNLEERDEFTTLTHLKDKLANMDDAVENRYFPILKETHAYLDEIGFKDIIDLKKFNYHIDSQKVLDQYFKNNDRDQVHKNIQSLQASLLVLRKNGRIIFEHDQSHMYLPGEILHAKKPFLFKNSQEAFQKFPVNVLSKVQVHMEMLQKVANQIQVNDRVLDIGCGTGLLASLLPKAISDYLGIDVSEDFINQARHELKDKKHFHFIAEDIRNFSLEDECYDCITIMNTLYIPGINPLEILEKSWEALKPGGKLFVSGPVSKDSLKKAQAKVFKQLKISGAASKIPNIYEVLEQATQNLMTDQASYWSVEGMIALLEHMGFEKCFLADNQIYYGNAFLIGVEK